MQLEDQFHLPESSSDKESFTDRHLKYRVAHSAFLSVVLSVQEHVIHLD